MPGTGPSPPPPLARLSGFPTIAGPSLKRVFGLGETLATTLAGLVTRIATKICAYTPTPSWPTLAWGDRKGGSRTRGPQILATLI